MPEERARAIRDRAIEWLHAYSASELEHAKTRDGGKHVGPVTGGFACPFNFGNHLHKLLSAFALAVAANKSLTWVWSEKHVASSLCMGRWLHFRPWLQANWRRREILTNTTPLHLALLPSRQHWGIERKLACVGGAGVREMFATGTQVRLIERRVTTGCGRGADSWSCPAAFTGQEIAALSMPRTGFGKSHPIFALGPHFALGTLFHAAFEFDAERIRSPVARHLHTLGLINAPREGVRRDCIWVGVHMRHAGSHSEYPAGGSAAILPFWHAARGLIETVRASSPEITTCCAVLVASDRNESLEAFAPHVAEFGCTYVTAPVDAANKTERKNDGLPNDKRRPEQGARRGQGMLRDLYLLSLADHLVSTFMSTLSLAAQELIAARFSGGGSPMLVACHHAVPDCAPPRPLIVSDASAVEHSWWYGSNLRFPQPEFRDSRDAELGCES